MGSAYKLRIARVDLTHGKSEIIEVERPLAREFIGGVGLGAKFLSDETSAATGPFSPDNRLMFMTGPLTGRVSQSSRAVVCGLSPANDAWGEAMMGGTWGAELSYTGLCGIVISGKASRPVYLYINNDKISIEPAEHLWGKDTFETDELLKKETDGKASVAAIGRAGENLVRFASVVADGRLGRVAARCGMGAVMGSKNLKAVVVRGACKPEAVDEAAMKVTSHEVTEMLLKIKSGQLGPFMAEPAAAMTMIHGFGTMGVKNQSRGRWDAFNDKFQKSFPHGQHLYCRTCPVSCVESHTLGDARQQVMHMIVSAGTNCLIDDFDALQKGYELCNRYGIDNISFGYALSFAMEAFEKGAITRKDTGGLELTWGNAEVMLEMIRQIGENEGFGKVLGQGVRRAAEQIGKGSERYALHVKGLEVPYWDARLFNSLALGYATGCKGASHFESPVHILERRRPEARFGMDLNELGFPKGLNRFGWERKPEATKVVQDVICLINSLVVCQFSYQIYGVRLANYLSWLNAITGWDVTMDEFRRAGERIFNLKRLINLKHGLTEKDDTLPPRILEKLPDLKDEEQRVPTDIREQVREYYKVRGWDEKGVPTRQKLRELGL